MDSQKMSREEQVEPYYVCHENYYHHLMNILKRLEILMDCYLVVNENELLLTHNFILSAFSVCIKNLPRYSNSLSYIFIKELDSWSVKCILEYIYTGVLTIPKHSLNNVNKMLQILNIDLGNDYLENDELIHFTLNNSLKCDIVNRIWLSRNDKCDVKILTEGMRETFAHSAILSACSDQLFTLFRAHGVNNKPVLIVLLEFNYEDVETVLKFCYHGDVDIKRHRASNVCELAKILGIKDLYNTISSLVTPSKHAVPENNITFKISCLEHKETTKKLFRTLFEKESLSDIQLICSDHTFKVHSAVLNLSPYFQTLFSLNDWRHSLVFLSKLSLETVQAFVDYMYYGEVVFSGNAQEFASAMDGLVDFTIMPINSVEAQQHWVNPDDTLNIIFSQKQQTPLCLQVETKNVSEENTSFITNNTKFEDISAQKESKIDTLKEVENKLLTYTCDTCSAIFYSRRSLKLHLNTHPEYKSTKCTYCDEVFDRPSKRKIHERSHTGSRPFACDTCGKCYSTQSALGHHKKSHTESPAFQCELCSKTYSRKEYLEEHIRTHTGTKPFQCSICSKSFVGKTGLNHHLKIHEPPKKDCVCEVCGKAFTRKALWTHMKSHNKQYKCEICCKFFSTSGTLKSHNIMTHHEDKLFSCDICGKKFGMISHLNRHKKNVHNPSRLYHCDKCPKTLSSELQLSAHEKSKHTPRGDKIYPCSMCSKKFSGRSALIYHQRSHSGYRPHSCEVCTKSFSRPDALQQHLRSHTNERPYKCNLCDHKCSSKSGLNKHMKRHNKNKIINNKFNKIHCEVCNEIFNTENEYDLHKKENYMHIKEGNIIENLPSCITDNISRIPCNETTHLQSLQTMEVTDHQVHQVTDTIPQQFIQVYVPGDETQHLSEPITTENRLEHQLPIIQMSVQNHQNQYIQVYVPDNLDHQAQQF